MKISAGTRILITGASRGIGAATALALAPRGVRLVLAARDRDALESVAARARAAGAETECVVMDVCSDASVEQAAAQILASGPIDVLINNAGVVSGQTPFLRQCPAEREREMAVNFFGCQRVARALLPSMLERRQGILFNVSSILGEIPCPSLANYCASKAALNAWSHALRGEVEPHGVRVVVFVPAHTHTETADALRFDGVYVLPLDYTVSQLLYALDRAPRSMATSPFFRAFLRVARLFPHWAERRVAGSTRALLAESHG